MDREFVKDQVLWKRTLNLNSAFSALIRKRFVFGLGLLAKPKAIVIIYWNFNPHQRIYGETRGKVRITACKAYQCGSKKARGNKIYFQLNMIVNFKFKRNTERYPIIIV